MTASQDYREICLKLLIDGDGGANLNATFNEGNTALFSASSSLVCAKIPLEAGANMSVENDVNSTPLINAIADDGTPIIYYMENTIWKVVSLDRNNQ